MNVDEILRREPARDRFGRYLVRLPGDKKARGRTRVTTFIKSLDQGDGLIAWKATACMIGALRNPGLHAKWAAIFAQSTDPWYASDELKTKCKKLVDECADHGGAQSRADLGTALHAMVEAVARGEEPALVEPYKADVEAWRKAMFLAGLVPEALWTEVTVYIERYDLVGTFDGLFWLTEGASGPGRHGRVLGDLKTEQSTDYKALNHAAQLAAYSLATHRIVFPDDPEEEVGLEPLPDFDRNTGLIIHLPAGEARCTLHAVDLEQGREALEVAAACRRLDAQRKRKDTGGLMRPWSTDLAPAATPLGDAGDAGTGAPPSPVPATIATQEDPWPTNSTGPDANGTTGGPTSPVPSDTSNPSTPTSTTGFGNPPTTTSRTNPTTQTDLVTRLKQIGRDSPTLLAAIRGRWPIAKTVADQWDTDETAAVAELVDELDVEGPRVDEAEAARLYDRLNALPQDQLRRVIAWHREAETTPGGRSLNMKAGNHTTRRAALVESCIVVAQEGLHDGVFWGEVEAATPSIKFQHIPLGEALGAMNWRQAQHLLTNIRHHVTTQETTTHAV